MNGVKVEATIKLSFDIDGDLAYAIRKGHDGEAYSIAHSLVEDAIDCCGYVGKDMSIDDVSYSLN